MIIFISAHYIVQQSQVCFDILKIYKGIYNLEVK